MKKRKTRTYCIDGDSLDVSFAFHEQSGAWIGDYPYFEEEPRITPSGRRWRNVTFDDCPHAEGSHGDCGTCIHLKKQSPNDLVGVCFHEALRQVLT